MILHQFMYLFQNLQHFFLCLFHYVHSGAYGVEFVEQASVSEWLSVVIENGALFPPFPSANIVQLGVQLSPRSPVRLRELSTEGSLS